MYDVEKRDQMRDIFSTDISNPTFRRILSANIPASSKVNVMFVIDLNRCVILGNEWVHSL